MALSSNANIPDALPIDIVVNQQGPATTYNDSASGATLADTTANMDAIVAALKDQMMSAYVSVGASKVEADVSLGILGDPVGVDAALSNLDKDADALNALASDYRAQVLAGTMQPDDWRARAANIASDVQGQSGAVYSGVGLTAAWNQVVVQSGVDLKNLGYKLKEALPNLPSTDEVNFLLIGVAVILGLWVVAKVA